MTKASDTPLSFLTKLDVDLKILLLGIALLFLLCSCGGGSGSNQDSSSVPTTPGAESGSDIETPAPPEEEIVEDVSLATVYAQAECLIITSGDLEEAFEPLAEWKNQKGTNTQIVSVSDIYDEYFDADSAAEVRSFLQDVFSAGALQWAILGGDTPVVPYREICADVNVLGFYQESGCFASDLYFADLDGNWDANGNREYGEPDDGVEGAADIWVGRLPVDDEYEAQAVVEKIIAYERDPDTESARSALFLTEDTGYFSIDAAIALNPLAENVFPSDYTKHKLYETYQTSDSFTNTKESQIEALNAGYGHIVHYGHGTYETWGFIDIEDVSSLTNRGKTSVCVSTSCYSGAFHVSGDDSIAEYLVKAPEVGFVAFIGYTHVGIGFPSGMEVAENFYERHFVSSSASLGETFWRSLNELGGSSAMSSAGDPDRWTRLAAVLLGDPEMAVNK